ncbi:MAG: NAD(P)H-hydrate dehydratase [Candidatus Diapherotrites archaeon]|nr:NAD(P)H-hydrate dehydratase [Candidatus Diapherotrites archaeon]
MRGQHKGENGRVLVIGGGEDYVGAPALAGMAALRSGCDIAVVAAPEKAAYAINSMSPDLITKKLLGRELSTTHVPVLAKMAEGFDCVVIGPGLGEKPGTLEAVRMLCSEIKAKKVLDADALKARPVLRNCIVTPHAKEFEVLFGKKATKANAKKAAKKDCVVLLKGPTDIITDGSRLVENRTGNDGMTVGGSGDCLAGLVAGLVAQGMPLFKAAAEAARVNGLAGDALLEEMGYGFVASDLLDVIPLIALE